MNTFTNYKLDLTKFPESLPPWNITLVKALSTLAKFALPLVLESIYQNMEHSQKQFKGTEQNSKFQVESFLSILIKITISLTLSYFLELYFDYLLTQYRLNIKKQLTKRIVQNNILTYIRSKQQGILQALGNQKIQQNQQKIEGESIHKQSLDSSRLSLWTDISSKMPVYVYNFHNSLLSLIFESLNILGVCVYLFMKLSYSLLFGLVLALIIMKKINSVTKVMQAKLFNNIELTDKKLKLLKSFFHSLVQYKMTWLDKWMWQKVNENQKEYQKNLSDIKYLDVWCVVLWKFTSIGISSIIVLAFYLLGIRTSQTITPSTLIQFLMILTMPLNALSWNLAGLRNSLRAIQELKYQVTCLQEEEQKQLNVNNKKSFNNQQNQTKQLQIIKQEIHNQNLIKNLNVNKLQVSFNCDEKIKLIANKKNKMQGSQNSHRIIYKFISKLNLNKGTILQVVEKQNAEQFLSCLPFSLQKKLPQNYPVSYVQQNAWHIDNILESICFKQIHQKAGVVKKQGFPQLGELLERFECHDIPEFSKVRAKQLSGGEKMRISLVRAFWNSKIVVINSDLTSLDLKMRQKVVNGIKNLAQRYKYIVIIRKVQSVQFYKWITTPYIRFQEVKSANNNKQSNDKIIEIYFAESQQIITSEEICEQLPLQVNVSKQISEKLQISILQQIKRQSQIRSQQLLQKSLSSQQQKQNQRGSLDGLKWKTFRVYFKSKYHLVFLASIISTTFLQHFYQFYMNNYVKIQYTETQQQNIDISINTPSTGLTWEIVRNLLLLTIAFSGALFARAYYFAKANIVEGKRISQQLDQNIVMNEMSFYQNFYKNLRNKQNINSPQQNSQTSFKQVPLSQKSLLVDQTSNQSQPKVFQQKLTSNISNKLIYHSTNDLHTLSDNFPWQANILFNNIATTISSILIVFSQIPLICVILIPIVLFTIWVNHNYQKDSQKLLKIQKVIQENLMKTVHQLEDGIKIIHLYGKIQVFTKSIYESVDKQLNMEWKLNELKRNMNAKYKTMMILFLIVIVVAYGVGIGGVGTGGQNNSFNDNNNIEFQTFLNKWNGQCKMNFNQIVQQKQTQHKKADNQRNKSGQFAMLINYTIILANFMQYLTVSMGDTLTHALSIQRIRPILSKQNSQKSQERLRDFQKIIKKIRSNRHSQYHQMQQNPQLVSISQIDFAYNSISSADNSSMKVFQKLNFVISPIQKIQIKGKSGNGKTTFYKLLCSLYKQTLNTINYDFHISFSPQHPLELPQSQNIQENIDPYKIYASPVQNHANQTLKTIMIELAKQLTTKQSLQSNIAIKFLQQVIANKKYLSDLTYHQKIIMNNLRAWLYGGKRGIKIYDEPYWVNQSQDQTYVLTTHQRQFSHTKVLYLQNKKLVQK